MNNLVSIIMPTYNSSKFVEGSVASIINQTYGDWELLISDDCSDDETVSILEALADDDDRIKVLKLSENGGAGVARNNSIKESSGRFIAFCDSDDQWKPDKLEKQVAFMLQEKVALSYTSYDRLDESDRQLGTTVCPERVTYRSMLKNNYIGCLTAMYDVNVLGKVYMPSIRKRQDWALWLKILKSTNEALGLTESLALYRVREGSISTNKLSLLKYNWAIYRHEQSFGLVRSCYSMVNFIVSYILYKSK